MQGLAFYTYIYFLALKPHMQQIKFLEPDDINKTNKN